MKKGGTKIPANLTEFDTFDDIEQALYKHLEPVFFQLDMIQGYLVAAIDEDPTLLSDLLQKFDIVISLNTYDDDNGWFDEYTYENHVVTTLGTTRANLIFSPWFHVDYKRVYFEQILDDYLNQSGIFIDQYDMLTPRMLFAKSLVSRVP